MPILKVITTSKSNEWQTPQSLFDILNAEFAFTLDAAATAHNAKCKHFYTRQQDALKQPWTGIVWCNPPYGNAIAKFIQKGYEQAQRGATVVMLIPARTDTRYWHDYVMKAAEVRLIKGRLYFTQHGKTGPAPFPNAIIVFRQGNHRPAFSTMNPDPSHKGPDRAEGY